VFARLSLRARLILAVIALGAVGLVAADVATYSSLSSFLIDRTDSTLDQSHQQAAQSLEGRDDFGDRGGFGPGGGPGLNEFIQLRSLDGAVIRTDANNRLPDGTTPPAPKLPATIALPQASSGGDRVRHFTVSSVKGGDRYRVRASIEANQPNVILVLATSLRDVDSTLHRLLWIELLVTALVLAGMVVVGLWVVRLSLRPLDAIGATAAAIAGGELSRRIERADGRTEVGRLGLALNAMLAQIETAFKAREASERKLRRFVADASHELRTPLTAVRAYAELFTRGAASRPDDLERSMTGITRESERMSLLVDDLLLLARLDEGRPLVQEPVALDEVVREAVETARMVDPDRPLDAEVESLDVVGDRERLRQIVDNLLANVRSHTPSATPVHVRLSRAGSSARVTVADEGPGMTGEQAAHAFERFYRADESRARASGGVGLGLSIAAAVAEAHGGAVSVESTPGEGSAFHIDIPLAGDAQPAPREPVYAQSHD
jgi:two-component system, OmpR family, sensor kinase